MKKVVATSPGFFNGMRVRPGAEIEVPDDFKGSWVAAAGSPAVATSKPKTVRSEPKTLSEMGKAVAKSATDIA